MLKGNTDEVNLKLILVSGRTHEFQFSPSSSATEVCQYVFDNWPEDWNDEKVSSASLLKLIYHGRFLHGSVTLNALSLPCGKSSTTVMHLVTRENLPEPNSNDQNKKSKSTGCCRCTIC
ncbi:Ubiquitin-like protein 3 [Aphelenchoides besseyi]|nr:Ubiquitin-like protein 3 [Aphelenchoides besseyi]KAI6200976.1 Ubiquitin-like protein 3 [Aphelenchoides besseyi]